MRVVDRLINAMIESKYLLIKHILDNHSLKIKQFWSYFAFSQNGFYILTIRDDE